MEHLNNALHAKSQAKGFNSFVSYLENIKILCPRDVREQIEKEIKTLKENRDKAREKIAEKHQDKSIEEIMQDRKLRNKIKNLERDFYEKSARTIVDVLDTENLLPHA
jgi:hypothetical protein